MTIWPNNTKESILPVCNKPYHTDKRILQKGKELEKLRNYALFTINTVTGIKSFISVYTLIYFYLQLKQMMIRNLANYSYKVVNMVHLNQEYNPPWTQVAHFRKISSAVSAVAGTQRASRRPPGASCRAA